MKIKTALSFIFIFVFFQEASYGTWYDDIQEGQDNARRRNAEDLAAKNLAIDRQRRIAAEDEVAAYQRKTRELEIEISRLKLQKTQQNTLNNTVLQSNATSQMKLARRFYESQDYEEAINIWRNMADQGNADAQTNLGWMYAEGKGVLRDMPIAKYWTERATIQGNEQAQINWDVLELWKY